MFLLPCFRHPTGEWSDEDQEVEEDEGLDWITVRHIILEVIGLAFYTMLLLPGIVFIMIFTFGPLFSLLESWDYFTGFQYVGSCALGLAIPLTEQSPTTVRGTILAIAISPVYIAFTLTAIGLGAGLHIFHRLRRLVPKTGWGLGLFILVVIPVTLNVVALLFACLFAVVEKWDLWLSYKFAFSELFGLSITLTETRPLTIFGKVSKQSSAKCKHSSVYGAL